MSDAAYSTLGSSAAELDALIENGLPAVTGPDEQKMRAQSHGLAMAVAYSWLTRDDAAREVFLDQIIGMSAEGVGVTLAIELFTTVRLFGVAPGTVQAPIEIGPRWSPSASLLGGEFRCSLVMEAVTDLWTGIAAGDFGRSTRARVALAEMSLDEVRNVLRIMSYDTSQAMEQFAIWRGAGADVLDDYRRKNPPPNPLRP
jgi:hypothetical protein